MKIIALKNYKDSVLKKSVAKGDKINVTEARAKILIEKGVAEAEIDLSAIQNRINELSAKIDSLAKFINESIVKSGESPEINPDNEKAGEST